MTAWEGQDLSAEQAQKLEHNLLKDPNNWGTRLKLLGFYYQRELETRTISFSRYVHVLWMIDNHATFDGPLEKYLSLNQFPARLWNIAMGHWQKKIQEQTACEHTLFNAALFAIERDFNLGLTLFGKLETIAEKSAQYPAVVCTRAMERMRRSESSQERRKLAPVVLEKGQKVIDTGTHVRNCTTFSEMAEAAFELENYHDASVFSKLALENGIIAGKAGYEIELSNAYAIAGLLALTTRDLKVATENFNSCPIFVPLRCTLAEELIQLGAEKSVQKAIHKYLKHAIKPEDTASWLRDLKEGLVP